MEAAWLEGAQHIGAREGARERESLIARLRPAFDGKVEKEVVLGVVGELMEALLLPLTLSASPNGLSASSHTEEQDSLELAAAQFLGPGTPFFQFYTDFVTLYDATSFGHPLFAALLLPPLAQRYAPDYRKLLYNDTAHVLGTVRMPPERFCELRNRHRRSWERCSAFSALVYQSRASYVGWQCTMSRRIYGRICMRTSLAMPLMNADAGGLRLW
jgi:hypothetical protein